MPHVGERYIVQGGKVSKMFRSKVLRGPEGKVLKLKDGEALHTLGGSWGRGYLRKGKWSGGERFVSGKGECVREAIGAPSMLRFIRRWIRKAVALPRMLPTLAFELGVKSSAAEAELVLLVVLRMLTS